MNDTPETDAALRPNGLRAIADGLIYKLGQGQRPSAFFVADVLRVAAGKMEELQRERNVVRGLPRTWGAEYTDTLNLLKQQRDEAREALQEILDLVQRSAAWDTPNNVSGSLVAISDICEEVVA